MMAFLILKVKDNMKTYKQIEWIKNMWYIYTMDCYSAIKGNGIAPFAETWTDLETVIQSGVSQKEKNKYRIISLICGI